MTWRRFVVLLRGLSPHSALVTAIAGRVQFGTRGGRKADHVITDPKAADRAFDTLFRPPEPTA